MECLKAMGSAPIQSKKSPPSVGQAFLGAISTGVIALVLDKFTTTIEATLNLQTISDNFSVRQITITIRTIINGLCYLATSVFGINALGLFIYSGQLAFNSLEGTEDDGRAIDTDASTGSSDSEVVYSSSDDKTSGD